MKQIIKWVLIALIGMAILAVVGIILCKTVFKDSLLNYYNETLQEERVDLLRATVYKSSNDTITFKNQEDSISAANVVNYFRLDTIVNKHLDTWNSAIAVAQIICANIPHENQTIEPTDKTAIGLWQYNKKFNSGINCKYHSVMLHEMLNAIGIHNRIIWCMPMDSTDRDCHVVNHVWLPEYNKWAMLDSDMNTFMIGTDGVPMSIPEIRTALIKNNQCSEHAILSSNSRTNYYKSYLAKNLYWFETLQETGYNLYYKPMNYIRLLPANFSGFRKNGNSTVVTSDEEKFWTKPL